MKVEAQTMILENLKTLIESPPAWSQSDENSINQPYNHIASNPGKNFRAKLIHLFNQFYLLDEHIIQTLTKIVEILHNSSLIIDDIEDNSQLRRGVVASHMLYGVPMTINTANYMYFVAMDLLRNLSHDAVTSNDLMKIFNEELLYLHRGQGLDIYWRDSLPKVVPTEEMYFNMVMNKTGGLFRLTLKIMERLSEYWQGQKSLVPLGNLLGIIYQVRDDYLNLTDSSMIETKGFADDISEGKLSFPIIHGINYAKIHDPNNTLLLDILCLKTKDENLKKNAIRYLSDCSKSFEYTSSVLKKLTTLLHSNSYFPDVTNDSTNSQTEAIKQVYNIMEKLANV